MDQVFSFQAHLVGKYLGLEIALMCVLSFFNILNFDYMWGKQYEGLGDFKERVLLLGIVIMYDMVDQQLYVTLFAIQ